MKIAGIDLPDDCPDKCPGAKEEKESGEICARCPIFNCKEFDDDGEKIRLIEPDSFVRFVAFAWKEWFDHGMKGRPPHYRDIVVV